MSRARGLVLSVITTLALSGLFAIGGCAKQEPAAAADDYADIGANGPYTVDQPVTEQREAAEAAPVEEAPAPRKAADAPRREAPPAEPVQVAAAPSDEVMADRDELLATRTPAQAPVALGTGAAGRAGGTYATPTAAPAYAEVAKKESGNARTKAPSAPMGNAQGASVGYAAPPPPPVVAPAKPAEVAVAKDKVSNAEEHRDYGTNPFTMVAEDALSTFSIDVDTASYSMMRKKLLQENSLPSQAAVRVEEFVNYFDYHYQNPDNGPFAVDMEAMPDPFRAGHHIVRVGVQGQELARDARPPVHLTFLVDVSGSTASADKLPLAKQSMHLMVDGLREDDTVALATYAGNTARILEPTSAANKRRIHDAIEALGAGGSTAMSAGIDIAYDMANHSFVKGHENRVVILSDGDANVGNSSWDSLLSQIKSSADKGVTLSTIGFGMGNYKDTLMEQLANKGDGNNFYIDDATQAKRVFVEKLGGTMVTIARDVKIQVEWNPKAVAAYRLVGYENRDIADKDFRNDRVDAGEVGSGHQVTALYEVVLKEGHEPTLATVRMRYEKPGADGVAAERSTAFPAAALRNAPAQASRDTRIAYTAATFAEVLRGSPHATEVNIEELIAFGKAAARPNDKDDAELLALMKKAAQLGANGGGAMISRR